MKRNLSAGELTDDSLRHETGDTASVRQDNSQSGQPDG